MKVSFLHHRNNGQPQKLGDCDLCVEFVHFLLNLITLERKKNQTNKSKNPVSCHYFDTDESFFLK